MKVPFLDLGAHHRGRFEAFHEILERTLSTSGFIGGPEVDGFEREWARFCETDHAIGVANGTDSIELILQGLGIGRGDEVIMPTNTFVATAEAVVRVGASPVFCDVEPDTLLMSGRTVEAAMGPAVAAIIAVHLFGQPVNMTEMAAVAERHSLVVIEDAAQAHGATWDGAKAGGMGHAASFSFYPGKNLGALGDGGAVTTNDSSLSDRIRSLANHGRDIGTHHGHLAVGRNSRLDGLQASFLREKLTGLDDCNAGRRSHHALYTECLPGLVRQVAVDPRAIAVHHLEVIRVPNRSDLMARLEAENIGFGVHYPVPCHRLEAYAEFRRTDTPVADRVCDEILSLPMYAELQEAQVRKVCEVIHAFTETLPPESASQAAGLADHQAADSAPAPT